MNGQQSIRNRTWFGALTASIRALCALFIDLVSVASEGVAMAHASVKTFRDRQVLEIAAAQVDFEENLVARTAHEAVKRREEISKYVGADKTGERQRAYEETREAIEKALARARAEVEVARQSV